MHRHPRDGGPVEVIDVPPDFAVFGRNSGLEALAIDAEDRLYTLPERAPDRMLGFSVWRRDHAGWTQPFHLPWRDGFRAVGAEIAPDGRFYLLERRLTFLGFQSRIRRWDMSDAGPARETVLLTTPAGRFGNLEGLSLWRDGAGRFRATLVADDNFWPVMRMQLVEFVLSE